MAFAITAISCPAGQYTAIGTAVTSITIKTRGGGEPYGRLATGASVPSASLTDYMKLGPKDFPVALKLDSAANFYFMPDKTCVLEVMTE